jgi:2-methylcitrate dehydratase PrpD
MVNALGLAGNFGVGLMAFAEEGTDDLMYHNSLASRNGILSAELAKYGAKSPHYIFETPRGVLNAYSGEIETAEKIIHEIGDHFKIEEIYFKFAPACAYVQSAASATLEIAKKADFNIDEIDSIKVRIFPHGKNYPGLDYCGPFQGVMQAQMSNPFTIASILIHKDLKFEQFVNFKDPRVESLAKRIEIFEDEEAANRWPEEQLVRIKIFLKNGSTHETMSKNPYFLNDEEVVEKCRYYVQRAIGASLCDQFIKTVQSIEALDDINKLTKILRKKRVN